MGKAPARIYTVIAIKVNGSLLSNGAVGYPKRIAMRKPTVIETSVTNSKSGIN
jgi:hypothetical protein